jgi:hypothetical protein
MMYVHAADAWYVMLSMRWCVYGACGAMIMSVYVHDGDDGQGGGMYVMVMLVRVVGCM